MMSLTGVEDVTDSVTVEDIEGKLGYGYTESALIRQLGIADINTAKTSYCDKSINAIKEAVAAVPENTASITDYKPYVLALEEANRNLKSFDINGYSAEIGEDVKFNFEFSLNKNLKTTAGDGDLTATVTKPDGTTAEEKVQKVTLTDAETGESRTAYTVEVEVAPKEIASPITVEISGEEFTYSVQEYLEKLIATDGVSAKKVKLAESLLNYGGYAQEYFTKKDAETNAYLSEKKANANVDTTLGDAAKAEKFTAPELGESISYYGASVTFDYQTAIKLYFHVKDDVSKHTFKVNGETVTPEATNAEGYYYMTKSGITAPNIGTAYTFTVDGKEFDYGVYNYVYSVLNTKSVQSGALTELQNLVKALYQYGESAKS